MKIERTFEKYFYLTGDDKSNIGNADPEDKNLFWDFFERKDSSFSLTEPLIFRINKERFSGETADFQGCLSRRVHPASARADLYHGG